MKTKKEPDDHPRPLRPPASLSFSHYYGHPNPKRSCVFSHDSCKTAHFFFVLVIFGHLLPSGKNIDGPKISLHFLLPECLYE